MKDFPDKKDSLIKSERILVAFFSWSGNTRKIAKQINKLVGGDIYEIKPVDDYPTSYNVVLEIAKKEIRTEAKPVLKNKITNLDKYDTIFIGYPNWWNTFPAPVSSFLSEYNFKGKVIIPYCTHGGGGVGRSFKNISNQCPEAEILEGFSINGYAIAENNIEVIKWIEDIQSIINE